MGLFNDLFHKNASKNSDQVILESIDRFETTLYGHLLPACNGWDQMGFDAVADFPEADAFKLFQYYRTNDLCSLIQAYLAKKLAVIIHANGQYTAEIKSFLRRSLLKNIPADKLEDVIAALYQEAQSDLANEFDVIVCLSTCAEIMRAIKGNTGISISGNQIYHDFQSFILLMSEIHMLEFMNNVEYDSTDVEKMQRFLDAYKDLPTGSDGALAAYTATYAIMLELYK